MILNVLLVALKRSLSPLKHWWRGPDVLLSYPVCSFTVSLPVSLISRLFLCCVHRKIRLN